MGEAAVAIFAAALAANLAYGNSADLALLFASVNTFSTTCGTLLVRRFKEWMPPQNLLCMR